MSKIDYSGVKDKKAYLKLIQEKAKYNKLSKQIEDSLKKIEQYANEAYGLK